jgi:hypothetical protein
MNEWKESITDLQQTNCDFLGIRRNMDKYNRLVPSLVHGSLRQQQQQR